jgi:hypothetical protein
MDYKLSMEDLGIANDSTVLEAESAGELVEMVVGHLRAEHDIDMPDAEVIMGGGGSVTTVAVGGAGLNQVTSSGGTPPVAGFVVGDPLDDTDGAAVIIVSRLRELLNLQHLEDDLDI